MPKKDNEEKGGVITALRDEYMAENDRENRINMMAGAMIAVVLCVSALLVAVFPFGKIRPFFEDSAAPTAEVVLAIIFLGVTLVGVVFLMMGLDFLLWTHRTRGYRRIDVDDMTDIETQYRMALCGDTDDKSSEGNIEINRRRTAALVKGVRWITIGVVVLCAAAIALNIVM